MMIPTILITSFGYISNIYPNIIILNDAGRTLIYVINSTSDFV
jgi:hypothetical protein